MAGVNFLKLRKHSIAKFLPSNIDPATKLTFKQFQPNVYQTQTIQFQFEMFDSNDLSECSFFCF